MDPKEKLRLLKAMLAKVAPDKKLDALVEKHESKQESVGLESVGAEDVNALNGLKKLAQDRDDVSPGELDGLEAIVLLEERPVVLITRKAGADPSAVDYDPLPKPWTDLNAGDIKARLLRVIPSVGRVELPNSQLPYGGTGFVVGPDLVMTNRHVARLFSEGLGEGPLRYVPGDAGLDFHREFGTPDRPSDAYAEVREVLLVHPFWDMALLRVGPLPASVTPLTLSVEEPEALATRRVAVVGYPAQDPRGDQVAQEKIFNRTYNVKRLQPGTIRDRQWIKSFTNNVYSLTHDCSTLGGNSGSAVIDLTNGQVLALHFLGDYLKNNYAVPAYELARDAKVVGRGVKFSGSVKGTPDWLSAWDRLKSESPGGGVGVGTGGAGGGAGAGGGQLQAPPPKPAAVPAVAAEGGVTWTIPLRVTVTLGAPVAGEVTVAAAAEGAVVEAEAGVEAPRVQIPIIYPDLDARKGYRPDFLGGSTKVPMPALTAAGEKAVARLEDNSYELKYHKFSVVVHRRRRLALFTASNVDYRDDRRKPGGVKPTRQKLNGGESEHWVTDPRIPETNQLPDLFFTKDGGAFDKGHLVRRDDVCWGDSFEDIQKANGDTFHTTNCSPQVSGFNQSAQGKDNWGDLENLIQKETSAEKAVVFSGPVLADDDRVFDGRDARGTLRLAIPKSFWKIVVTRGPNGLEAFGFVLKQDLSKVPTKEEMAVPAAWKRFMRGIGGIEEMLGGLVDLSELKKYDRYDTEDGRRLAESVAELA